MPANPTPRTALPYLTNFALSGQVALVTGASRGLGFEIASAFAGSGAQVVLNGRDPAGLQAAAERIKASTGQTVTTACFDVADAPAMRAALAAIAKQHGRLDILVNNVGQRLRQPLQDFDDNAIDYLLNTNLSAAIRLSQAAAGLMLAQGSGRLIAITSIAGQLARPADALYTTAKQGLTGLVRALAAEYGPHGITSNAIAPGGFATEANATLLADPTAASHFASRTPLGRWGQPAEIAGAAVFLASPAASYVNGLVLTVDGGMSIAM